MNTSPTPVPGQTNPSTFKKWAAAALLAGGVGVTGLALAGPASAQDDTTTTAPTEQTTADQSDASTAPDQAADEARPRRGGPRGEGLETVAETLGMSIEDLRAELDDDTSLADVAEANGVEVQAVIDAMVDNATTRLDEKVAEGDLTQAEADERLANLTERITERVNTAGRPEGRGGPGCDDGEAPADTPADGEAPADAPAAEGFGTLIG
ncbi:MAG: hypothetical protein R2704_18600 [Microthrixaceae bacterium]